MLRNTSQDFGTVHCTCIEMQNAAYIPVNPITVTQQIGTSCTTKLFHGKLFGSCVQAYMLFDNNAFFFFLLTSEIHFTNSHVFHMEEDLYPYKG